MNEVVLGLNQFCGPAVLSIFTGLDVDTCAETISEVNGKHVITGVMPHDLMRAGERLGLDFKLNEAFTDRSLFWTASALVNFPGVYLITIPRHYITIEVLGNRQIQICDNHTKTPIDLSSSARLSQKVEKVWKVTKVFDYIKPTITKDEIVVEQMYESIVISRIQTYSDGKHKDMTLGTIKTADKETIDIIISKLIEINGDKQ